MPDTGPTVEGEKFERKMLPNNAVERLNLPTYHPNNAKATSWFVRKTKEIPHLPMHTWLIPTDSGLVGLLSSHFGKHSLQVICH